MSPYVIRDPGRKIAEPVEKTTELIETLVRGSEFVLVKKLANNDRNWAVWDVEKKDFKSHQGGVLLPAHVRESGFFPSLTPDIKKPHNLSVSINVKWPTAGIICKSRFIWYSAKGQSENHWTTSPKSEFFSLAPASFVILFKSKENIFDYQAITVDSADEVLYNYIDEIFGISALDFSCQIFKADGIDLSPTLTVLQKLVERLMHELSNGPAALNYFVNSLSKRAPKEIAAEAYSGWQIDNGYKTLNPYLLAMPGNILYELTKQREFAIYKENEACYYGSRLVEAIFGGNRGQSRQEVVSSLVDNFDVIYRILLSAVQTRKTRAGGSFETHVEKMLLHGNIPNFPQPIFDGRKPDFILPSRDCYSNLERRKNNALVLTLKTTLRERWTQVVSESTDCPIFLATLDEQVPFATLNKLATASIKMVVPEKFKTSKYSEYEMHSSVITFKEFFETIRVEKKPLWNAIGIQCF